MEENTALNFYGAGLRIANAITLTGDPTFNVATGSSVTLSGAIIDGVIAGDLVKTGAGTLILAGNSTYTGGTAVEQGTLTVDGTLVGEVVVSNGAMINGSGTTGNTTFKAGSTLATESATSSIAVNGNLHFASGSTYQVALGSAGQSGSVSVAGNLAIDNGALLKLTSSNGVYSLNSLYRIATYNGSETGTFSVANTDFAYITPVITYGDGAIDLTLTPTPSTVSRGFVLNGYNRNQNAAASALTSIYNAGGNALTTQLLQADTASASHTLTAVAGDEATVFRHLASSNLAIGQQAISNHLYQHFAVPTTSLPDGPDLWVQTDVAQHTIGGNQTSGASAYTSHGTTVTLGMDRAITSSVRSGLALTAANSTIDFDERNSNGRSDAAILSWYTHLQPVSQSPLYINTIASYGWWQNHLSRTVSTTSSASNTGSQLSGNPQGDSSLNAMSLHIESGFDLIRGAQQSTHVVPYVAAEASHYRQNGYSETAGNNAANSSLFNLHYSHAQSTSLSSEAGLRVSHTLQAGAQTFTISGNVGIIHTFTGTADQQQAAFESAPAATYQISGNQTANNTFRAGANLNWQASAHTTLFAGISGSRAGHDASLGGNAGLNYRW